jgi:drug/metabolite transporter (DMT)-like permease
MAGNAMALLSSVFFAALILALRRENRAAQAAVTWGNVLCAAAMLPMVAGDLALTPKSLAVFAFLGIFQISVAYALFVRGLASVTATQASLTGMLEPVANPIWVFLFLGERPSVYAAAGGVVVLAAIAWHTMAGEPASEMPAPD